MKSILFLSLGLLVFSTTSSQDICPPSKGPSPVVPKPTEASLVTVTCSSLVVKWKGNANQTYEVKGTYNNGGTITITMGTNITCDGSLNCTATIPVVPGTMVTWSIETINDINGRTLHSYPVIGVLENPIPACTGSGVTFGGRVMLQGAYNTSTGLMNNSLNNLGILQAQASNQPYNSAGFNYSGTESVGVGFFAAHPDIVDWVLIELRDANAPLSLVGRRAAFVKQDGTLVETDGTNTAISFPGIAAANYHVTIRHRNHLSIRSAAPIDFNSGTAAYDFTTANFKSYKNQPYPSPVQMGKVWVMRGGNANINQNIRYIGPANDQNQVLNGKLGGSLSQILNNVYAPEDLNMNGNIKWSGPGNDQNFLLNVVLAGSLSTILLEQF